MHFKTPVLLFAIICIPGINHSSSSQMQEYKLNQQPGNPYATIGSIPAPAGFFRPAYPATSFAKWLADLPLKKDKTVYLYNGSKKKNQSAQFAVLDIPVGQKDLQQCADAVMRLRASWLFAQGKYDSIVFYDNEGKPYRFFTPHTPAHFNQYLETVFANCGTASLSKQLKPVPLTGMEAGDVFIRPGFPGHAVMVVSVLQNKKAEKKYMLVQSYMPAQDIHVLLNPAMNIPSPWFDLDTGKDQIATPEFIFWPFELKRW